MDVSISAWTTKWISGLSEGEGSQAKKPDITVVVADLSVICLFI